MPPFARRATVVLLCLAAAPAPATEEETAKVAVLDVRALEEADAALAGRLTGFLVSEAGQHRRLEVIGSGDVRTILGYEAERQLLGCEEDAVCLAELAGALGSRYLLVGERSRGGAGAGGVSLAATALVLPAVMGGRGVDDGAMASAGAEAPAAALDVRLDGFSFSLGWRW